MEWFLYEVVKQTYWRGKANPDWDNSSILWPACRRMLIMLLFCAAAFTRPMVAATVLGTVAGTVVDGSGKPVSNAHVMISFALPANIPHLPGPPVITGAHAASATADALGRFKIANLRAGQYVACAQTLTPGLLDPCHWAAAAPEFTVTAGQDLTGLKITMSAGAIISVHVDYPQKLLTPASGPISFDCQFYFVTPKGHHYQAAIQASSQGSRDHVITVPFGMPVNLQIVSPHLVLKDQSGNIVSPQGTGPSIVTATGAAAKPITYTVVGKK